MLAKNCNILLKRNHFFLSHIFCRCFGKNINLFPIGDLPAREIQNEKVFQYKEGSEEKKSLKKALEEIESSSAIIPIVIGKEVIKSKDVKYQICPFNHIVKVSQFCEADKETVSLAIKNSVQSQVNWDMTTWQERIKIFDKAADLIAGKYRQKINAALILGQGKTVMQAESDVSKLVDFLRINCAFLTNILQYKPKSPDSDQVLNHYRLRGCEGFWAAMSCFDNSANAANIASSPALMGNSVIWKPCQNSMLSNWIIFEAFREAGLPPGVINFVPSNGALFRDSITNSPHLAGITHSGTKNVFDRLYSQVGSNISKYNNYPRLLSNMKAKNYHFVHPSADCKSVIKATIKSAFEYSGQKNTSCSHLYVPISLFEKIKPTLVEETNKLAVCHPTNFMSFTSAVISKCAFKEITDYIANAKDSNHLKIIAGGCSDDKIGYYVEPTIILSTDHEKMTKDNAKGPILIVFVYEDKNIDAILKSIAESSSYGLCGSIFAKDNEFIMKAVDVLKMSAGNIYINDKTTGSLVGQQPFGGARHTGTMDKAGDYHSLLRFANPQSVKLRLKDSEEFESSCMNCDTVKT